MWGFCEGFAFSNSALYFAVCSLERGFRTLDFCFEISDFGAGSLDSILDEVLDGFG